jgi:glutaconate CoA-transferase subunit B
MKYSSAEMMTIAAARALSNEDVCFVGIGMPSEAANLARLSHAPSLRLIYESGTIEAKPERLPLSIGDGELCETALTTVSVPELFRYWLQGGRVTVGFLSGAQVDRFGNLNSTVIGDYRNPTVRLPGSGGAPEIATSAHRVLIMMRHTSERLVGKLDFCTSLGHGGTGRERRELGVNTQGPVSLVTDYCVMAPESGTNEFVVVSIHPGVTREQIAGAAGWQVRFAESADETAPPTATELEILRALKTRSNHVAL